jgi:hypothetical protein
MDGEERNFLERERGCVSVDGGLYTKKNRTMAALHSHIYALKQF